MHTQTIPPIIEAKLPYPSRPLLTWLVHKVDPYTGPASTVGIKKKFPFTVRTTGTGNPVPFPFNFHAVAVQPPFVFNPFYGQPVRSINQVNGLGSARN